MKIGKCKCILDREDLKRNGFFVDMIYNFSYQPFRNYFNGKDVYHVTTTDKNNRFMSMTSLYDEYDFIKYFEILPDVEEINNRLESLLS